MGKIKNYGKFYALVKEMPGANDGLKEQLVMQYTNGRTESLRDMEAEEYYKMCADMEVTTGINAERKRQRSITLHLMQNLGINTADWAAVDNFTRHPRIAGKPFRRISAEGLKELERKLRSIQRKGGLRSKANERYSATIYVDNNNNNIN